MHETDSAKSGAPDRNDEARRSRQWWPLAVAFVVLAIGASLLTPAGRHQWALSIFRQPTRYTTLYFNEAWLLPRHMVVGDGVPLTFTIGNYEGHQVSYRYLIRSSDGIYSGVLARSAISVPQGAAWLVSMTVHPQCKLSPCRIEVSLPGYPENIDFLINMSYPARNRARTQHAKSRNLR